MNIENIRSFVYVYQYNGFHRAAETLFVTQPSLSSRIRTLEQELNVTLLVRGKSGVTLTEAGRIFLPFAWEIVNAYDHAQRALNQGGEHIVIGTNVSVSSTILPHVFRVFQQKHPLSSVEILTNMPDALLALLRNRECDFLITQCYGEPDLVEIPVYQDPISLVVSPEHPVLRRKSPLDFREVALAPIVCTSAMANYWEIIEQHFKSYGLTPNIVLSVDSIEITKNMVLQGIGAAFLPELVLERELADGTLCVVELTPPLAVSRDIHLIHLAGETPPYRDFFVEMCRQYRGWNDGKRREKGTAAIAR